MIGLNEFCPVNELVLEEHHITCAKFPVIDAHNHLAIYPSGDAGVDELIEKMDRYNIRMMVDLDGYPGENGETQLKRFTARHPDRFTTFIQYDLSGVDDCDFSTKIEERTRDYVSRGAAGMKFLKQLGLEYRDSSGKFLKPDDDRLRPIWETAAKYNLPVTIHIGDPTAFFKPITPENERYEELIEHPDWSFAHPKFYRHQELMESRERLLEQNPDTRFIVAHIGSMSEDLRQVSQLLHRYPNMYVDTAERISDLGRQPYSARNFLIEHQDRVLYGTDLLPNDTNIMGNYRFFETMDEYFPYNSFEEHNQGRWNIYGVGLPDEVLKKIYHENALQVIPRLRDFWSD